ncbi:Gfo/Idh/MocA family oxidoreductase [Rhodoluna sp. KAS3]|uniref:Gfo/Idh/MocA family protein n=1 Tax=Rhodoluna sp. KAS3 TaxID=942880 RepID=UPI00223211E4|nr:Gfo/Idh/MocA family oxidoreductase [Rhodoluna sp. KAS3]BDS48436.1 oxidoreductase [Rhodoluna sp. KAS3]
MNLPQPNIIDPSSVTPMRWGVMGAAGIAEAFVSGVQKHTKQQIVAVASRTPGKAEAFAERFGIESHDNYEDLLAREDIDVIYIPTLPTQHRDHALQAIAAGKHVLIEKPITLDAAEAAEIFAAAKAAGVLAMEAMWTRYLPQYDIIRQLLADEVLGDIEMVNVSMCQANLEVPRLWKKGHGDPFFDMGIYPVSFAQSFLGNPTSITAQGKLNADRIEEEVSVQLGYANGARAYILLSARASIPAVGQVAGTKAKLTVGPEFCIPSSVALAGVDFYAETEVWKDPNPIGHEGLAYQATALASFVDQGLLESPFESHKDSIANLKVCEEVIRLIGAEVV